jgi:hypothetical protein
VKNLEAFADLEILRTWSFQTDDAKQFQMPELPTLVENFGLFPNDNDLAFAMVQSSSGGSGFVVLNTGMPPDDSNLEATVTKSQDSSCLFHSDRCSGDYICMETWDLASDKVITGCQ